MKFYMLYKNKFYIIIYTVLGSTVNRYLSDISDDDDDDIELVLRLSDELTETYFLLYSLRNSSGYLIP